MNLQKFEGAVTGSQSLWNDFHKVMKNQKKSSTAQQQYIALFQFYFGCSKPLKSFAQKSVMKGKKDSSNRIGWIDLSHDYYKWLQYILEQRKSVRSLGSLSACNNIHLVVSKPNTLDQSRCNFLTFRKLEKRRMPSK